MFGILSKARIGRRPVGGANRAMLGLMMLGTSFALQPPIAVIGASGKLGQRIVERLLSDGRSVRCLRRPGKPGTLENVEYVEGDVGDAASLVALMQGCEACIAAYGATRRTAFSDLWQNAESDPGHAKQVNYEGVRRIIHAARETNCTRIVRITGRGEAPWSLFSILINALGSMAKAWNYEGETLLRGAKDVRYTIIRPGVMTEDAPETLALGDDGADLEVAPVSYRRVADLCVDCLETHNTERATLCATTAPEGPTSWGPLLENVKPDRREFPSSLYEQHRLAVRVGASMILAALALLAAAAVTLLVNVVRFIVLTSAVALSRFL